MRRFMVVSIFALIGCILMGEDSGAQIYPGYMKQGNPMMRHSMVRHRFVQKNGLPEKYRNLTNPLGATENTIKEGSKLYATACASCHGEKGYGDGDAGAGLNPRPSHLASAVHMPVATDAYLFWAISEGGKELKTAMPAFKESLSEQERWKIVLYLRLMTGTRR